MTLSATRLFHRALDLADHLVPAGRQVVVRTFPDFDDQCREIGAALADRGITVTVLADDRRPPVPPLEFPCRVVASTSLAAAWAFARARVVVHTHGVYGNIAGARGKRFVNIWHGMPVKRLPPDSAVGRHQTDVTVATSTLHARHLAETWGLATEQVVVCGLPRNDALARSSPQPSKLPGDGRPLAVWLPTFRSRPGRPTEQDGTDLGTVTQFEGADVDRMDAAARRAGVHLLVKPHPAAAPPTAFEGEHLTIWGNDDLREHGWTLYRLLAHASLLITDVSSVWIDFLALDRPILFAMSDRDSYVSGRGTYFDDLDAMVPGPISTTMDELEEELLAHASGADPRRRERAAARAIHNPLTPGTSADEVAKVVVGMLDGHGPTGSR